MDSPRPPIPPVMTATRMDVLPLFFANLWLALDGQGDAHTSADTQCREPALGITLLHLVEQRHQNARARRTYRVTDRDRATIHVHDVGVPSHILVNCDRLRGERLVGLD